MEYGRCVIGSHSNETHRPFSFSMAFSKAASSSVIVSTARTDVAMKRINASIANAHAIDTWIPPTATDAEISIFTVLVFVPFCRFRCYASIGL